MRISDWSSDVCSSDLAQRRAQGGRVHALVEVLQSQQAERPDEGEQRARQDHYRDQDRRPRRQGVEVAHSITSPRIRNFDRATVLAKPSSPMIRPASTSSRLPVRMPIVSSRILALTYRRAEERRGGKKSVSASK